MSGPGQYPKILHTNANGCTGHGGAHRNYTARGRLRADIAYRHRCDLRVPPDDCADLYENDWHFAFVLCSPSLRNKYQLFRNCRNVRNFLLGLTMKVFGPVSFWLKGRIRRWYSNRSGNATLLFAFCIISTIGVVGVGVDYYTALSYKTRLDSAADSAAISAITTAQAYINANSSSQVDPYLTNNAIAAGQSQASKVFAVNSASTVTLVSAVPSVSLQRSGQTFTASAKYTGAMKTAFGKLFGVPTLSLAGTSKSSLTMGSYLDFYLALDVSGSMGLPTSNAGQTLLAKYNPDNLSNYPNGCVFACHFPGYQGYSVARAYNIALRVDSVGNAVLNLINTANQTRTLTNQYRIGIYPFIVNPMQAAPLSSNFSAATTVANTLGNTYLDTGLSNSATQAMGSGGTHFENLFTGLYPYIAAVGNGSSALTPKPFIFIVTDGADNNQTYTNPNGFNGSQPQQPTNFGYCQYAQALGVTISILYIPYIPIQILIRVLQVMRMTR